MKKAIITILSIILIAGLFVACSNEVETPNGAVAVAYTEVLESNGAFKVGDKSYASLQEAVNEAAKTSGTVKLQQDVTGRGAIIPEDKEVTLDLNGKSMVLTDADNGAILLSSGSILTVQNGTLSLLSSTAAESTIFGSVQAKVSYAGDRGLVIDGTAVIDAGEGTAVSGDKLIVGIAEGADVSGNLFVSNGTVVSLSDNVKGVLFIEKGEYSEKANKNASLQLAIGAGATVNVDDSAKVVIVSVPESNDWNIVCSGEAKKAEIIDEAQIPVDTDHIVNGFCYVVMGGARHYTGSLAEAITWAAEGSKTVVYALNHPGTATETISADAVIDLNGHTESNHFAINPGVTLTIIGDEPYSVFEGNISKSTTEGTGDRNLVVMNAKVTGAITKLTSVRTSGAVIEGIIGSGDGNAVDSVYDGWDDVSGYSTFSNDIYTTGAQVYNNSIFSSDSDLASLAESTAITINNAIGAVGNIRTYNGSILINNAKATDSLTTGTLTAWNGGTTYHDVIIKGNKDYKVTVATIDYADEVMTSYAILNGIGGTHVGSVKDGGWTEGVAGYSTFNGNVETTGNQTYFNSSFTSTPNLYSTAGGDISLTNVTGTVGAISASGTSTSTTNVGDVTINNSSLSKTATQTFTTGTISAVNTSVDPDAYGDVTIMGASATNTVTVDSIAYAAAVKSSYAVFGAINATSVEDGWTDTAEIAGYSVFNADVATTGAQVYNNSTFTPSAGADKALSGSTVSITGATFNKTSNNPTEPTIWYYFGVTATGADSTDPAAAALTITKSTGTVGTVGATNGSIVVDNTGLTTATAGILEIKGIYADGDTGDVTLSGNSEVAIKNVIVDGITDADAVVSSYVNFAGAISGTTSISDTGSSFGYNVTTSGAQEYNYSSFGGGYLNSTSGGLSLTSVSGTINYLTTYGDITINNSDAGAALSIDGAELGSDTFKTAVKAQGAGYDVSITSNYALNITGRVIAADEITMSGDSIYVHNVDGSEFVANVTHIYGGTYGAKPTETTYDSVSFDGSLNIHSGNFYVNGKAEVKTVAESICGNDNNPVNIYMHNNITLDSILQIGKHNLNLNKEKVVSFYSDVASNYNIVTTSSFNIDVYSGTVKFMSVNIGAASETDVSIRYRGGYADIYNAPSTTRAGVAQVY